MIQAKQSIGTWEIYSVPLPETWGVRWRCAGRGRTCRTGVDSASPSPPAEHTWWQVCYRNSYTQNNSTIPKIKTRYWSNKHSCVSRGTNQIFKIKCTDCICNFNHQKSPNTKPYLTLSFSADVFLSQTSTTMKLFFILSSRDWDMSTGAIWHRDTQHWAW